MATHGPPSYKGRNLGIIVLVVAQVLIGIIHVSSGFFLLSSKPTEWFTEILIYGAYTLVFGILVLFFSYGLWNSKSWGRNGTLAVSAFVIVADFLALFDLPSIPGIPKLGAFGEIIYSLLIVAYLSQNRQSESAQKPNKPPATIKK